QPGRTHTAILELAGDSHAWAAGQSRTTSLAGYPSTSFEVRGLIPLSYLLVSPTGSEIMRATGTFDVKLAPMAAHAEGLVGRMSIDKQFAGDLSGVSKGEMLAVMSKEKGSGGYTA